LDTQHGDTLNAQFLHKKKDSSLWYYRRRYPKEVAKALGKGTHMQSLQTTNKREAERLSRRVSVEFDTICHDARLKWDAVRLNTQLMQIETAEPECVANADAQAVIQAEEVLAKVPGLVRLAATRAVEEQMRNPKGWQDTVRGWAGFYRAVLNGQVTPELHRPAIEAQAILNGYELALKGQPLPPEPTGRGSTTAQPIAMQAGAESGAVTWTALCDRALREYKHKVGEQRYKLAVSKLPGVKVRSSSESDIQDGLRDWCNARLQVVKPRTVKGQLDCMMSALRCVMPKLVTPSLRELKGVMQPRVGDRQSMPIQEIRAAVQAFKNKPASAKVRKSYGGGASQFDATAVEVLAVLGMRPRELLTATRDALIHKTDAFGEQGLFLRLTDGKNKASEREIPLSDGTREVLPVQRLREMLEWQEKNERSPNGAVTSFGTRFKEITGGGTLYQMRHSWKDVAVNAGVDSELRERLMGHKVPGVSAVYGSGIPLARGLDALLLIRDTILGEKR
jgi:hypothetical protein